jgi:hypothetical protein
MRERHQLFFGFRLMSKEFKHPAIQTKIVQTLADFFIKESAPAYRKTGFYASVIQKNRRLDSFLHEAAQNFEVFSNIQEIK